MAPSYETVDKWIPIYIRILGTILGTALVIATILGRAGIDYAGAYVFVAGMIAYKSVHDYGRKVKGSELSERSDSSGTAG